MVKEIKYFDIISKYHKMYNLCHNLFMWRVLSSKSVFPYRITIIPLPFITCHVNKLYHKLWTSYTTNCTILCVTIVTLFAFIFFPIHVLLFFSVLSIFFLGTLVLSLCFNLLPLTDYSIESMLSTYCSVSHEGDYLWITNSFESNRVLSFTCKDTQNKNK